MIGNAAITAVAELLGIDAAPLVGPEPPPEPDPVELQDPDIRITPAQRAYLQVFDQRLREWRTYDDDRLLQGRYCAAFEWMMAGAYPLEGAA